MVFLFHGYLLKMPMNSSKSIQVSRSEEDQSILIWTAVG